MGKLEADGPIFDPQMALADGAEPFIADFWGWGEAGRSCPTLGFGAGFGHSGPLPVQFCSNFRDRPFDFFLKFPILAANLRGPPGRGRQRHTHGQGGQRRLDGLFLGVLHPPLPHRDAGAPAGDQHRHQDHLRPARWVLLSLAS